MFSMVVESEDPRRDWGKARLVDGSPIDITDRIAGSMFHRLGKDVVFIPGQIVTVFVLEQKYPGIGVYTYCHSNQGLVNG